MEYMINSGMWSEVIALPAAVVDDYIKLASGASLKVLLYMLRHSKAIDTERICTDLNLSQETIEDSFAFWEQLGILSPADASSVSAPVQIKTATAPVIKKKKSVESATPAVAPVPVSATDYSPAHLKPTEIDAIIKKSDKLKFLSQSIQQSFARPLTYSEQNLVIWMSETLGFDAEIIMTLCEYCADNGKANARYIETLANSWFASEINTFDKANAEVSRLTQKNSYINSIISLLKLKSYPSSNQRKIIDQWHSCGFSDSVILKAYDRTVDSIGSLQFPYMNKILTNWHSNGLMTVEAIESFEGKGKKSAPTAANHSYNLDDFEALAVGAAIGKE